MFYLDNNPEHKLILYLLPPPELHFFLGVINKLFESLEKLYSFVTQMWAKQGNIEKKFRNGGKFSSKGNACKLLLKNIDKLQAVCKENECITGMLYVETFRKFEKVVNACFRSFLEPEFEYHIEEFKKSYEKLGISITPKIHAVCHHVTQFCL